MSDTTFDLVQAAAADLSADSGSDAGVSGDISADAGTTPGAETGAETSADSGAAAASADGTPAAASDSGAQPAAQAADADEAAQLAAIEAELVTKTPNLKKGRIPVSRHQAVLTRERRQAEEKIKALEGLRAAADQFNSEPVQTALKVMKIAQDNPDAFVRQILMNHPSYRPIFDALLKPSAQPGQTAPPETTTATVPTERPAPDVLLPDGTIGYSAKQTQALVDWFSAQERQSRTKERAELEKKLADLQGTIKPFQEEAVARREIGNAMQRMKTLLDDARKNWPSFSVHEAAIREELKKPGNERQTLEQAYRAVVVPKLATDRTKLEAELRQSILAELNKAKPVARNGATGAAVAVADDDNESSNPTEDIVRQSLRALNAA